MLHKKDWVNLMIRKNRILTYDELNASYEDIASGYIADIKSLEERLKDKTQQSLETMERYLASTEKISAMTDREKSLLKLVADLRAALLDAQWRQVTREINERLCKAAEEALVSRE
jgi:hypothetical protein